MIQAVANSEQPSILHYVGKGIYTPTQTALYANIPVNTVRNWIFGSDSFDMVFDREFKDDRHVVSFCDFVQALRVRSFRTSKRPVRLSDIRDAIRMAQDEYNTAFPLAMKNSHIYQVENRLAIKIGEKFIEVSRRYGGSVLLPSIAKQIAQRLTFDKETDIARSYHAYSYKSIAVEMNPQYLFGAPYLPSCCYSADTLARAVRTEGGYEAAADAYGVKVDEVKTASRFIHLLQKRAA